MVYHERWSIVEQDRSRCKSKDLCKKGTELVPRLTDSGIPKTGLLFAIIVLQAKSIPGGLECRVDYVYNCSQVLK